MIRPDVKCAIQMIFHETIARAEAFITKPVKLMVTSRKWSVL